MNLAALDQRVAELQTHLQAAATEIADARIGSSITDEYKRALGHEQEHLTQHLEVLTELRALFVSLDGLYAPLGVGVGLTVKSGLVNLAAGGTSVVTFGTAFPVGVTPRVTVSSQFNTSDTSTTLCAHTVSRTGFTIRGAGNLVGNVAWIATSAGNL